MKLLTGLNPYGLTYHLGLQARGTPRANPHAAGLEGFLALGRELDARTLELWDGWLLPLGDAALSALKQRLTGATLVVSAGLERAEIVPLLHIAAILDAPLIRLAATPILCGDRASADPPWPQRVRLVRDKLGLFVEAASHAGRTLVIENHQDFTSEELVALCEEFGPTLRIAYDTGNSFPVAEAPLDFTRSVAPYVAHVHLKDYRVQRTQEGIRLVRCAIGDGAVPLAELVAILAEYHAVLPAVLEPGALEARHVRLLTDAWWQFYPPRDDARLERCLQAIERNELPPNTDWRTPWERNEDGKVEAYELDMIRRSATNMRALGIM